MKIPAIRAKIGTWDYYVTTLTFEQVDRFVSKVDDELHTSESLNELIQRSITNNYLSIKDYIINQKELFFNALVLAVYDDYPNWREIEFKYDGEETYQMGLLEFPGNHKIFPVDGQHRVEGIKAALKEKPELGTQRIAAIFIGHKNDPEGMQRSRRLFSTLNRYAKPVTMDDIIALDEDDSVAIVTRELLETFDLFANNRVTKSSNKAILDSDKQSFTSIITLYQCNRELLKQFRAERKRSNPNPSRDSLSMENYLKFRPKEEELTLFNSYCIEFWMAFKENFVVVRDFLNSGDGHPALAYRNKEFGGNLLFRPIGLLPLIQASIEVQKRIGGELSTIFQRFNMIEMTISVEPWKNVLWNPNERTMIMTPAATVRLILLYMYGMDVIKPSEISDLKKKYADKISSDKVESVLVGIPVLKN
ncbi:MAG: DGQHR domain-containing protein [Saprospiraceae bacterium]|nr:DGQHR domain-containing protein [Saprospiraceae bacterium]